MQVEINSYKDIGAYLREVRESLNLDVRTIGQQLNIRAKYLEALEEGKLDVMPGKVYARGYLLHYAEYLGLSKEEIAEAFDRTDERSNKVHYFVPEPTSRSYQPGMLIVGTALAVVLVVYYFWYQNHDSVTPPDYDMVSPVPQRLLDPINEPLERQENDDTYIDPMLPPDVNMPGDNVPLPTEELLPPQGQMGPQAPTQSLPWLQSGEAPQ
jgi:cytoskeleton protein RodZ